MALCRVFHRLAGSAPRRRDGRAIDASFFGVYASPAPLGDSQVYLLFNSVDSGTDQLTLGAGRASQAAGFTYRLEGAHQTGRRTDSDMAAVFAAARAGRVLGRMQVEMWNDYLSGDDDLDDDEIKVFDTLFATNHKFYGYVDFFLNIPEDTAGRGLQDPGDEGEDNAAP